MESGLAAAYRGPGPAPRISDWRQLGRRAQSGQYRVLFSFSTAADCLAAHDVAFRWWREPTSAERTGMAWQAGATGRAARTWWRYEVFYFAPNQADLAEAEGRLVTGLAGLRQQGGAWGQQSAARIASRAGLAVVPETEVWDGATSGVVVNSGLAGSGVPPPPPPGAPPAENPWAVWRRNVGARAAQERPGEWL